MDIWKYQPWLSKHCNTTQSNVNVYFLAFLRKVSTSFCKLEISSSILLIILRFLPIACHMLFLEWAISRMSKVTSVQSSHASCISHKIEIQ